MDGGSRDTENSVHVIAASNRPEAIDPAMLRPGRLGVHLFVGVPSAPERAEILSTLLQARPMSSDERGRCEEWVKREGSCDGMTGADLESLCHEASLCSVERASETLELADLESAVVRGVKASVGKEEVERWRRVKLV